MPVCKTYNDKLAPQVLVDALSRGATQQFDLNQLEAQGMTVRILKLEQVSDGLPNNPQNGLQLVGFLQLRPQ